MICKKKNGLCKRYQNLEGTLVWFLNENNCDFSVSQYLQNLEIKFTLLSVYFKTRFNSKVGIIAKNEQK